MTLFAVDAGGSRTRVLLAGKEVVELPSVNRHATGDLADDALREVFELVRHNGAVAGWFASASVDPEHVEDELERVRCAASGVGGHVVVSNDVVPLLWGVPELAGGGVVAVCGTGSGFLGADGRGRVARAGGCEYLGSDEGGAVDIGWRGLRAAVRSLDGRGGATTLVDALGGDVTRLARDLAARPFPKQGLANLAGAVCAAWVRGDHVAGEVVDAAVGELVAGVRAVRHRLGLPDGFAVATTGGVLTGCPELQRELTARLRAEAGAGVVVAVEETARVVLAALERLVDADRRPALPEGIAGRHAWLLAG